MTAMLLRNINVLMPSQQVKAGLPMTRTDSGISETDTFVQSQKAHSPIVTRHRYEDPV